MHGTVLVGEDDGRGRLRQLAHQVQAALAQQRGGEADAHGAVVVAGDGDDRHAAADDDLGEDVVEQLDGLGGRDGAVVEVAGDRARPPGRTSATSATSCSSTCSWSRVRWTLWNSRPRCQSAVWMSLMAATLPQGRTAPAAARAAAAGARRPRRPRRDRIGQVRTFRLSKSRITAGLQCGKRLWLAIHRPELEVYSADTQRRFAAGNSVGEMARELYGAGDAHRRRPQSQPGAARHRGRPGGARRRHAVRGHLPPPRRAHPRRRPGAPRRALPHGRGQVGHASQGVPPAGRGHPGLGHGGRRRAARRARRGRHRHRLRVPRRRRLPRPAARDRRSPTRRAR